MFIIERFLRFRESECFWVASFLVRGAQELR